MKCTLQIDDEHVTWAEERASNWLCVWPKRVRKKLYSEHYKRYGVCPDDFRKA